MKTYELLGLLIVGFIGLLPIGTAILFIGLWVGRVSSKANNAEKEAQIARDRAHDLSNELMNYKKEVATEYVRHGALERLEARLMDAIHGLGQRIDSVLTREKGP